MKKIIPALACLLTFSTCKKDEKQVEPQLPPVSPATPTGTLKGKVYHYDQFGTLYSSGLHTATVSIEGKNFSAVTDASGSFTLTGIPSSTYTLIFEKPGCGTIRLEDMEYKISDTTTYRAELSDMPSFTIDYAYAKDTSWFSNTLPGIFYGAATSPVNAKASIVAIVGKSPNIHLADPSSYLNYATSSLADSLDFKRFFSYSLLKFTYSFKKDSLLYMKIYPVSTRGASYLSNELKTMVYTSFGTPYPTVFTLQIK